MKEYKNFKIITKELGSIWYLDIRKKDYLLENGDTHEPKPLFFKEEFSSQKEAEEFGENYINKLLGDLN